jgi:hypothetical protein
MTGAFSLMLSQYPQSRAIAQLATGLEVECQDEYGSTRPPSTENYQIAWVTFAPVPYRCRTSALREAVTAWRGTKSRRCRTFIGTVPLPTVGLAIL